MKYLTAIFEEGNEPTDMKWVTWVEYEADSGEEAAMQTLREELDYEWAEYKRDVLAYVAPITTPLHDCGCPWFFTMYRLTIVPRSCNAERHSD